MAQNGLTRRIERLEGRHPGSPPVFAIHGRAGSDGRCPDCDLGDVAHFTITIDGDRGSLERRYIGIDLEAV